MNHKSQIWRWAIALILVACQVFATPSPTAALELDPRDYFAIDYCISLSDTEVQEDEVFYLIAECHVECIEDLPMGATQAEATARFIAQHKETGDIEILNASYSIIVNPVPDWKGDTYEVEEHISLIFPSGTLPGEYEVIVQPVQAEIDDWDITHLIPESYKSVSVGTVTCVEAPAPPPPSPSPPKSPNYLTLGVLGDICKCEIRNDGRLAEALNFSLATGEISLSIKKGTFCLNKYGNPLGYISVSNEVNPSPCETGSLIVAYSFNPGGAKFNPSLELVLSYREQDLPPDVEEDALYMAYYDRSENQWIPLESQVDIQANAVAAEIKHFTTFAIIAVTVPATPGAVVVSNLTVSPEQVEPGQPVTISVEVKNEGGVESSHIVNLVINGVVVDSRELILAPEKSKVISYQVSRSKPGNYNVTVEELSVSFTVIPVSSSVTDSSSDLLPLALSLLSGLYQHWLPIAIVIYLFIFVL